ncbi:LysR family transcriptional regulator [Actinomadura sp. DC4]|uniref:LysR family transcriptional regulator n=1 Tax=Actinomadura sp. DC4 TaxID=3055069 RepID=UPI0025B0957B|nr:LysR family transcriptional regulator [Actinomadura sp. DC4]MDN3359079.1 LysR family transcriptional regulator [Actinomadura sp. DC4]
MDRLTGMRSFVGVAQAKSFSHAARSLGISRSLVSRHIADLESQLGVRLFNRTARAVSLTEPGQHYFEFCERVLAEIDAEEAALQGLRDKVEGQLSIICPKWIGHLDLGEAIASFAVDHPKIHVRFEVGGMSDRNYDFLGDGYDIAFHTRELRDSSLLIKKVASLEFLLCAAPDYLEQVGPPEEASDLAEHDCLVNTNDPVWHLSQDGRKHNIKVLNAVYSSNSYLTLQKAAVRGRGIGLLPMRTVCDDVAERRLVRVLPAYEVPNRSLYAIYSPGGQRVQKVKVFLDYISEWFLKNPMTPSRPLKTA